MPNLKSCLLTPLLELNMTPEEEDEYSLEEKFDAAVKVIRTLPEDGPFQPSDDMMLMFYSYYKQATLGPCTMARPTGFWDTRGKAKWDAWSALGNMTREEAMKNYVEDIQLILEAIPISSEVTDLVQKLGNFYTEVESDDEDADENALERKPFTRPFANYTDAQVMNPSVQGFGDFWDDIQNLPEMEKDDSFASVSKDNDESKGYRHCCEYTNSEDEATASRGERSDSENDEEEMDKRAWNPDPTLLKIENKKWRSDNWGSNCSSMEPSVSSFTNGTHSSLNSEIEEEELACSIESAAQYNPYMHFNGYPSDHSVAVEKNVRSPESDNEEFCDSMEHLAMEEIPRTSKSRESRSTSLRRSGPWFDSFSALSSTTDPCLMDGMGTSEYKSALSQRGTCSPFDPDVTASCCCGSQRPQSLCRSKENINEQIAAALLRLQQDMDTVLYRLQTLEVLTTSQPPSPSQDHCALATAFQFNTPSWWPLQPSPVAVFFTVVWPVFAHWLVQLYLRRKRRRIT